MDVVSDFITRLRNGIMRSKLSVRVRRSNLIINILECLYKEGYIRGFCLYDREVEVFLKYKEGWSVIRELKRISKPSRRVYFSKKNLYMGRKRNEIVVYSSVEGIKINSGVSPIENGGEVLFSIK